MARSMLRQMTQVSGSLVYDDTLDPANAETMSFDLEDDLNYIRSQINKIVDKTNWYDDPRSITLTISGADATDDEYPTAQAVYEWVNTVSGAITSSDTFLGLEDTPDEYRTDPAYGGEVLFYADDGVTSSSGLGFINDPGNQFGLTVGNQNSTYGWVDIFGGDYGGELYLDTALSYQSTGIKWFGLLASNGELLLRSRDQVDYVDWMQIHADTYVVQFPNASGIALSSGADVNEILSVEDADSISAASTDDQLATAKLIYNYVDTVSGSITSSDTFAGLEDTPAGYSDTEVLFYTADGVSSSGTFTFDDATGDFNVGASNAPRFTIDAGAGTATMYGDDDTYIVVSGTGYGFAEGGNLEFSITADGIALASGARVDNIVTTMTLPDPLDTNLMTEEAIYEWVNTVSGAITSSDTFEGLEDTPVGYHNQEVLYYTSDGVTSSGNLISTETMPLERGHEYAAYIINACLGGKCTERRCHHQWPASIGTGRRRRTRSRVPSAPGSSPSRTARASQPVLPTGASSISAAVSGSGS